MTSSTLTPISGILEHRAMKFLAGCQGPCITVVIPAHHPGAQEGSRKALIHALVRTANERLTAVMGLAGPHAAELLAPLDDISRDPATEAGGPGFAIFRSPEYTARYYLPDAHTEKLVIGDYFWLAPFVANAYAPHDLYVLGLSTKQLRLFRYLNGDCDEVALPPAIPRSLEAAGAFDKPDHALENRSASGPSTGAMRGVHMGTLSDREKFPEYLHHFFETVDRGLKPILEGKPLLIMGVQEELAAYRRVARYPHLLETDVTGNIDFLTPLDISVRAAKACGEHYRRTGERVLREYRELPDRARTLAAIPEVLQAAKDGRVHRLCVREGTEAGGATGSGMINAAIVETLRTGGEVFVLPPDKMTAADPMAAILRY